MISLIGFVRLECDGCGCVKNVPLPYNAPVEWGLVDDTVKEVISASEWYVKPLREFACLKTFSECLCEECYKRRYDNDKSEQS